jgi:hypothetical protein
VIIRVLNWFSFVINLYVLSYYLILTFRTYIDMSVYFSRYVFFLNPILLMIASVSFTMLPILYSLTYDKHLNVSKLQKINMVLIIILCSYVFLKYELNL